MPPGAPLLGRRSFVAGIGAGLLLGGELARAQPRAGVPRIGFLFAAAPPAVASRIDALREGLAALGLAEGRHFTFEPRYAFGDLSRLKPLAEELVALPVSVIVTGGSSATRPARAATSTIPIVMGQDNDPVASGVVGSLARPGGNVTGLSTLVPELAAKQMALLAELVPRLARVAVFEDSGEAGNTRSVAEAKRAAGRLNVAVQFVDLRKFDTPAQAFAAAINARAEALLFLASASLFSRQDQWLALAFNARLPAIYAHPEFVQRGGLATYGVNVPDLFRRAAIYVFRILGGTPPAELPIEQPTRLEFVINLKTARAIGLAIPQPVLLRADELIE